MLISSLLKSMENSISIITSNRYTLDTKTLEGSIHRLLKKIYTDSANIIVNGIKANPQGMKNVIGTLQGKRDRLMQDKKDQNRQWKDVSDKNFTKSLDHRAFYFKKNEKTNTNTKGKV